MNLEEPSHPSSTWVGAGAREAGQTRKDSAFPVLFLLPYRGVGMPPRRKELQALGGPVGLCESPGGPGTGKQKCH